MMLLSTNIYDREQLNKNNESYTVASSSKDRGFNGETSALVIEQSSCNDSKQSQIRRVVRITDENINSPEIVALGKKIFSPKPHNERSDVRCFVRGVEVPLEESVIINKHLRSSRTSSDPPRPNLGSIAAHDRFPSFLLPVVGTEVPHNTNLDNNSQLDLVVRKGDGWSKTDSLKAASSCLKTLVDERNQEWVTHTTETTHLPLHHLMPVLLGLMVTSIPHLFEAGIRALLNHAVVSFVRSTDKPFHFVSFWVFMKAMHSFIPEFWLHVVSRAPIPALLMRYQLLGANPLYRSIMLYAGVPLSSMRRLVSHGTFPSPSLTAARKEFLITCYRSNPHFRFISALTLPRLRDFLVFNASFLYGAPSNNRNVSQFISFMNDLDDASNPINIHNKMLMKWIRQLPTKSSDVSLAVRLMDRLLYAFPPPKRSRRFYSGSNVSDGLCGYNALAEAMFGDQGFGPLVYSMVAAHSFLHSDFNFTNLQRMSHNVDGCSLASVKLLSRLFDVQITLVYDGEEEEVTIGTFTDKITLRVTGTHVSLATAEVTPLRLRGDFVRAYCENPYHLFALLDPRSFLTHASLHVPLSFMLPESYASYQCKTGLSDLDILSMVYCASDVTPPDPDVDARPRHVLDFVTPSNNNTYETSYPVVCLYSDVDTTTATAVNHHQILSASRSLNVAASRVRVAKLSHALSTTEVPSCAALALSTIFVAPSTVSDDVVVSDFLTNPLDWSSLVPLVGAAFSSQSFVMRLCMNRDEVRKCVSYIPVEQRIYASIVSDSPVSDKPPVDWMLRYGDIRTAVASAASVFDPVINRLKSCFKKAKKEVADYAANEILSSLLDQIKLKFDQYGPIVLKLVRLAAGIYCIVKLASNHTERIILSLITFAPEIKEYLPRLIECLTKLRPQSAGNSATSILDVVVRMVASIFGVSNVNGVSNLTMEQVRNFSLILMTAKSLSSVIVTILSLAYDVCSAFYERWLLTSQPVNKPVHDALDSVYAAIIATPSPIVDFASASSFIHDREILIRFHAAHARFGTYRTTTQTIDKLLANSTHLMEEASARLNAQTRVAPPLAIYVSGGAGIGKTTMLNALYKTFYAAQKEKVANNLSHSKHHYRNDECAASDVWAPPKGETYLGDAYRSTPITRFDDYVVTQARAESNAFFTELFNMISKENNPMLCANPANKGKVFYTGDLVTVTTNSPLVIGNATLACMAALRRRFDVIAAARRDRDNHLVFDILDYLGNEDDNYVIRATYTEAEFLRYVHTVDTHRTSLVRTDNLRVGGGREVYEATDDFHFLDVYYQVHASHLSRDFRNTSVVPAIGANLVPERRAACEAWLRAFNFTRDLTIDGLRPELHPVVEPPPRNGLANFFVNHMMLATQAFANRTIDATLGIYNTVIESDLSTIITVGASALVIGHAMVLVHSYCRQNGEDGDLPDTNYNLDPQNSNSPATRHDGKSKGANQQKKSRIATAQRVANQRKANHIRNNQHLYSQHNNFDAPDEEEDDEVVIDDQIVTALLRSEAILTAYRKDYAKDLYGLRYVAGKYVFPLHYDQALLYGDRFELTYPDKEGAYHTIDITHKFTAHRSTDRHILCIQLNRSDIHGGNIVSALANDLDHFSELNLRESAFRMIHPELDIEPVGTPKRDTYCGPGLSFQAYGQDGDCGMPYFMRVKNPEGVFLLGFHTHGSSVESFMTILTNSDIVAAFGRPNFMPVKDPMPAFRPYLHEQNRLSMEGIPTFFPTASSHRPSLTHGQLQDPVKVPMELNDPEFARNAVSLHTNCSSLNMVSLRRAIELFLIKHPYGVCHPLTVDEAFGVSSPIGMMNTDSSAGYNANGFKKKSELFEGRVDDAVTIKEAARLEYVAYENELYQPVNKSSLKDETRTSQKVTAKAARLFFVAPYYHVVYGRRYMGELAERFQSNCVNGTVAIGINPLSNDWSLLYRSFTRFGENGRYLAGDKKQYDTTIPFSIMWAALRVIRYYYPSVDDDAYDHILSTICVGTHTFMGFQMVKLNGNSSGGPYTSLLNSICNALMTLYCMIECAPLPLPDNIWDYIDLHVYGDDDIMSIDVRHITWFDMLVLQKELKRIGVTYTSAHKDREITAFMPLSDIVFLQRSFSAEDGGVFAPRPLLAVMDQMQYYKQGARSDPTDAEITRSCAISIMYELSQHPASVFEQAMGRVNQVLKRVGIAPLLQTHSEIRSLLYFDSGADRRAPTSDDHVHPTNTNPLHVEVDTDSHYFKATGVIDCDIHPHSLAIDSKHSAATSSTVDNAVGHSTLTTNPNQQQHQHRQHQHPADDSGSDSMSPPRLSIPIHSSSYRVARTHQAGVMRRNAHENRGTYLDTLLSVLNLVWSPQAPPYQRVDAKPTRGRQQVGNRRKRTISNNRDVADRMRTQRIRAARIESLDLREQSEFDPSASPNVDQAVMGDVTQAALVSAFLPEHNPLLTREFKVGTITVSSASSGNLKAVDILPTLMSNPYLSDILRQYRTYTFDVSLTARVSGTMAYDALVAIVYVPRNSYDIVADSLNVNRVTFPYYQHLLFNIVEKKDHTLLVSPYTNEQGFSYRSIHQAGHFNVTVIHPLMGPPSNAESVSISLYLKLDNVSLFGRQLKEQSSEASEKSMGRNFADLIQGIPKVVDPARRIAKGVVEFIANPFGFQQPTDTKIPEQVINLAAPNPLNVRGLTSALTMTMDPATQASTNLSDAVKCASPVETLLDMARTPGVLANFSVSSLSPTIVYSTKVGPSYFYDVIAGQKYSTPFRIAATQATMYSGSCVFTLQVTASPFARCSLQFTWTSDQLPESTDPAAYPDQVISRTMDFSGSGTYTFVTPNYSPNGRVHTKDGSFGCLTISVVNPPYVSDDALVSSFAATLYVAAAPDTQFFHRTLQPQTNVRSLFSTDAQYLSTSGSGVLSSDWEGERIEHLKDLLLTNRLYVPSTTSYTLSRNHIIPRCFNVQRIGYNLQLVANKPTAVSIISGYPPTSSSASSSYAYPTPFLIDAVSTGTIKVVVPYVNVYPYLIKSPWVATETANVSVAVNDGVDTTLLLSYSDDTILLDFTYPGISSEALVDSFYS